MATSAMPVARLRLSASASTELRSRAPFWPMATAADPLVEDADAPTPGGPAAPAPPWPAPTRSVSVGVIGMVVLTPRATGGLLRKPGPGHGRRATQLRRNLGLVLRR